MEPAQEAGEWFAGADVQPNKVKMETFFKGKTADKPTGGGGLKKGMGLLDGLNFTSIF